MEQGKKLAIPSGVLMDDGKFLALGFSLPHPDQSLLLENA